MTTELVDREAAGPPIDVYDPSTWPPVRKPDPPFDDAFVRRFVKVSLHVQRFSTYYLLAFGWLVVMAIADPIGIGGDGPGPFASPAGVSQLPSSPAGAVSDAPSGAAGAIDIAVPAGDFAPTGAFDEFAVDVAGESSGASASFGNDYSTGTDSFPGGGLSLSADVPKVPKPLMIVESGYASVSGGTPFETEPPNGGLPVTMAAGQEMKRSYVRLSGDEDVLALKPATDPGSTEADELAGVKMCPVITADWPATRKQAMSSAPAIDTSLCATGLRRSDGVWVFDFAFFDDPTTRNGWALVGVPGTANSFQIVFAPRAVIATDT